MVTANHYLLDAVGGAAVLAAGYGLARLVARFGTFRQHAPQDTPAVVAS